MNDASSAGPSSSLPDRPASAPPLQHATSPSSPPGHASPNALTTTLSEENPKAAQRRLKLKFLDHLIRSIDIMVYCELSILYYMDCSLTKFLIRALPHWLNFTPKPDIIPPVPPGHRPYVSSILGSNAICMLLHLAFRPPAAGEATRGYLHGGWFMDFVGQASPASKWELLGSDLLCLALQILILCVFLEKQTAQGMLDPMAGGARGNDRRQDHDAEESGLLRRFDVGDSAGNTGVRDLRPQRGAVDGITELSNEGFEPTPDPAHPLDSFYTGDHLLANINPYEDVRVQWKMTSAMSNPPSASGVQTAASLARQRFTAALGRRARTVASG